MKQTATNYLIDQLSLKAMAEHIPWVSKILDTAIEMEREQIINAHKDSAMFEMDADRYAEQYYSDTYIENRDTQS
jgi:hypothetical protein